MGLSIWEGNKAQELNDNVEALGPHLSGLVTGLNRQNLLLTQLVTAQSQSAASITTLNEIYNIVTNGKAPDVFNYGDQINLNWNDGTNDYVLPWDVVHFGDFELQDGETKPGMVIQSHYALQGVQFDASEAIYATDVALPAGTYQFTIGTTWGSNCIANSVYNFTTTEEIPAGGQIMVGRNNEYYTWGAPDNAPSTWRVHTFASASATTPLESNLTLTSGAAGTNLGTLVSTVAYSTSGINNLQRAAYGYNRWSQSANRQYYNSDAIAGSWWSPQNPFDRAPGQLSTVRGFKAGFDAEFLNIIKPVKVTTLLNTVSDTAIGESETTYDTFFLPSLEQEYIVPQVAGVEGDYWEYWKQRLGRSTPQGTGSSNALTEHIRYGYDAKTTAQTCRLRSANRGIAHGTWNVTASGTANYYYSTHAYRGCPACVII